MDYYYLTASLPPLSMGESAPISSDDFFIAAESLLSSEDRSDLARIVSGNMEDCQTPFMREWVGRERQLRNALVMERVGGQVGEAEQYLREQLDYDARIERAVNEAMAETNPIEREGILDRARWNILDDMASEKPFGPGQVFAFALKLQIVERWNKISEVEGRERLDTLVGQNVEQGKAEL
ncbi:MAG: DUF2764 family protein [Candidatus Sumerlaeota bacterium]